MDVVAIPKYDTTKFRTCRYLPVIQISNSSDFEALNKGTYEFDFMEDSIKRAIYSDEDFQTDNLDEGVLSEIEIMEGMKDVVSKRTTIVNS